MEENDGGGRSGSGFSCMNMNHHHHNNNQNNDMVMGFNGVGAGGGGGDNTMMMMMMPPLSTTTTTTSTANTTSCSPTTSSTGFCFPPLPLLLPPPPHRQTQDHATNNNSSSNNNNQFCVGAGGGRGGRGGVASNLSMEFNQENQNPQHFINKPSSYYPMADLHNHNHGSSSSSSPYNSSSIKAKIMAHPHYPRLLAAYINCQKVGAPPEVVARLEEACAATTEVVRTTGYVGEDPGLDQFMEAYCEMLTKYEQELSKPFKEAMVFLSRIESQFKALTLSSSSSNNNAAAANISSSSAHHPPIPAANSSDGNGSSDEEIDMNTNFIDPQAEDTELKCQLLRKYSGYLGSLKQEFMKKRKKGKLPKEARQQLLDWWTRHYKWPYPSEAQKMALAEATGLDPKQINNWFINQRKRHWKPSEDMQFVVMDAAHPHHYYMDHNNVLGNPFPMDISPALL